MLLKYFYVHKFVLLFGVFSDYILHRSGMAKLLFQEQKIVKIYHLILDEDALL